MTEPNADISLIPLPQKMEPKTGRLRVPSNLRIRVEGGSTEQLHPTVSLLGQWLSQKDASIQWQATHEEAEIQLVLQPGPSSEAYRLEIRPDGVILTGSETGWVRGVAALTVLLEEGGWPCCVIEDAPRFSWRGMHLDVCRHYYPVDRIKRLLDLIALHRMNTFHWHLTDDQGWRLASKAYPALTQVSAWRDRDGQAYGGYYTAEEVAEVLRYAQQRHIEVVPEIEMPGHAMAALAAFPELSCHGGPFEVANTCGIFDDVYCAGKPATFEFLETILGEVVELFPGRYVHIGGDECPKTRWKDCPDCQAQMKTQGLQDEDQLQSWLVSRMGDFLQAKGKRMLGWDEILEGGLPDSATVMSWRGIEGGLKAAQMGHDVVMSPTTHCYFDYRQSEEPEEPGNLGRIPIDTLYGYEPIPDALDAQSAHHILGVQGNIWTERMPTWKLVEYMILPRMCALSEVAWSPADQRDWKRFEQRLMGHLNTLKAMGYTYRHPERLHREFPL